MFKIINDPLKIKWVKEGKTKHLLPKEDFEGIATKELEASVSMIIYSDKMKTLSHLTNESKLWDFYKNMFELYYNKGNYLIIGGNDNKSENLITELNLIGKKLQLKQILNGEYILGEYRRHIAFNNQNEFQINHTKQYKNTEILTSEIISPKRIILPKYS